MSDEEPLCVSITALTGDPDHWFRPEDTFESADAAALCFTCPFREACLKTATEGNLKEGIWGGMPASVRKKKKNDYDTLVDLDNPYLTENGRSPHHADKLRPYDPEVDDDE